MYTALAVVAVTAAVINSGCGPSLHQQRQATIDAAKPCALTKFHQVIAVTDGVPCPDPEVIDREWVLLLYRLRLDDPYVLSPTLRNTGGNSAGTVIILTADPIPCRSLYAPGQPAGCMVTGGNQSSALLIFLDATAKALRLQFRRPVLSRQPVWPEILGHEWVHAIAYRKDLDYTHDWRYDFETARWRRTNADIFLYDSVGEAAGSDEPRLRKPLGEGIYP